MHSKDQQTLVKIQVQKKHSLSGLVVYMVSALRVELGIYWIIESKSVTTLDELLVKIQIQKNHSLSGFVVYMVPAPRVELGTY